MAAATPTNHYSSRFDTTQPYTIVNRKERSRELAQKRRTTYKGLMKDLADELPFSKDVVSQVDYNSRLRLALCFFRMKSLLQDRSKVEDQVESKELVPLDQSVSLHRGLLQDLITDSLDGFLLVILSDGDIVYISESIHKHLGLFQSEHIGFSVYDLIHEDDHVNVKNALDEAEARAMAGLAIKGSVECSFFCRMKCSRFKVSNTATKCPGYKLVFVSGHLKFRGNTSSLVAIVRPVSPPSILEIRMEGNMFVTHYNLEMKCIFFDGRLRNIMGYEKADLITHVPFEFHHHDDVEATLECSRGLMQRGEGLSGYYRFLNKFGEFVWIQSRATMMFDSRTGKPSYIVCMNFIISREKGEKSLEMRNAIADKENSSNVIESSRSHDPFPVPREDGVQINPLESLPERPQLSVGSISEINESESSSVSHMSQCPDSRSISPDSTSTNGLKYKNLDFEAQVVDLTKSNDQNKDDVSDRGYHSFSQDSYKSSIVSPLSVVDSAIGSDCESNSPGNVFSSPEAVYPIQVKAEAHSPSPHTQAPTMHKSALISLLKSTTPLPQNIKTTEQPSSSHSPLSKTSPPCVSPQYSFPTQVPNSHQQSFSQPVSYLPSQTESSMSSNEQFNISLPNAQYQFPNNQIYTQSQVFLPHFNQIPTGQPTLLTPREGYYMNMTTPTNQPFLTHSTTGVVTQMVPQTVPPFSSSSLPVLKVEDVQFLDTNRTNAYTFHPRIPHTSHK